MWRTIWRNFMLAVFMCVIISASSKASAYSLQAAAPEEGVYLILPKLNTNCALSVQNASSDPYANVVIQRNNSGKHQQWKLTVVENGSWPVYKIEAVSTGKVLNVHAGIAQNGTEVTVAPYGGLMHQYQFIGTGTGYYVIKSKVSTSSQAYVIDVAGGVGNDGTNVHLWGWNESDAQLWKLVKVPSAQPPTPPPAPIPDPTPKPTPSVKTRSNAWYKITTANGLRRVLDVGGAKTTVGSDIQLYDDVNANQQKFYLENIGNGYFTLKAGHCDLYVAAANASGNNYTNVELAAKSNDARQQWRLIDAGGGLYYIESRLRENLSFDCKDRSNANGTTIQLWNRGDVSWNKWKFTETSAPAIPKPTNNDKILERMQYLSQNVNGYRVGTKYTGTGECRGFANKVYTALFNAASITGYANKNYAASSFSGSHVVGRLYDFGAKSTGQVQQLFNHARPGSFLQMGRRYRKNKSGTAPGPHTAILYRVRNDGCEFYEANVDGANLINIKFYSWSVLADRNLGFTIYEPDNYALR